MTVGELPAGVLGDLGLGTFGAVVAAGLVHTLWSREALATEDPPVSRAR